MVKVNKRLRNFCFTFNNYNEDELGSMIDWISENCSYGTFGKEVGENGTPHLQGYCELKSRTRFNTVKKAWPKIHIEDRLGTAQQASDYCHKEDPAPYIYGVISKQGKRNDLVALRDAVKSGMSEMKIIENDTLVKTYARHMRFHDKLRYIFAPRRTEKTRLVIYWGPTGTGKSHRVITESPDVYYKDLTTPQFWDGYDGTRDIVLEDFRGEISLCMLLRLADKYPMQVQVKGGTVNFSPKTIYITSNVDKHSWFNQDQKGYHASMAALERRIDVEDEMYTPYESA